MTTMEMVIEASSETLQGRWFDLTKSLPSSGFDESRNHLPKPTSKWKIFPSPTDCSSIFAKTDTHAEGAAYSRYELKFWSSGLQMHIPIRDRGALTSKYADSTPRTRVCFLYFFFRHGEGLTSRSHVVSQNLRLSVLIKKCFSFCEKNSFSFLFYFYFFKL